MSRKGDMKIFMNIFKTGKRKILAGIMSAIMVLFILPITNFTAKAAETEVQQRLEFAAEKGLSEWVDTEGYLKEAIRCYRSKYGVCAAIDNYVIYFEPFAVMKFVTAECIDNKLSPTANDYFKRLFYIT